MEAMSKTRLLRTLRITGIALTGAAAVGWLTTLGYSSAWTGFGIQAPGPEHAKTLWDWMDLLLVPVFLAGGVFLLSRSQRTSERQRARERQSMQQEIETDRQQEEALQAYFDRIIELVLKEKLSKFSPEEVRNAARTRTLSVLRRLDARRKGLVILFLRDSGLIDRSDAVIDLCGADLRGALLAHATLKRINLGESDLSNADLRGANLTRAYLGVTNMNGANLDGANLTGADLLDANLNGADLSHATLKEANLNGADLRACRLNQADIREADLSGGESQRQRPGGRQSARRKTGRSQAPGSEPQPGGPLWNPAYGQ